LVPKTKNLNLKKRIIDIAYKHKLSHLSSYLTSVSIIDRIYSQMREDDIFILSSGHCSLALYVVLEKYKEKNAEELLLKHGGHPCHCEEDFLHCSTGSLGMGLTAAVGRAQANKDRDVFCLISDGECAEGSIWESLKYIYENNVTNIKVFVNINGHTAYNTIDEEYLSRRLRAFLPKISLHYTKVNTFSFLHGVNAHYHVMSEQDYQLALERLRTE